MTEKRQMQHPVSKREKTIAWAALHQPPGRLWSKSSQKPFAGNEEDVTGNSQHRLLKNKPYLTKLTAFYDEMIGLVDKREGMDEKMRCNLPSL